MLLLHEPPANPFKKAKATDLGLAWRGNMAGDYKMWSELIDKLLNLILEHLSGVSNSSAQKLRPFC